MWKITYGLGGLGRTESLWPCSADHGRRWAARVMAGRDDWTGDPVDEGAYTNEPVRWDDKTPRHGWVLVVDDPDGPSGHEWCPECGRLVIHGITDAEQFTCRVPGQLAEHAHPGRCGAPLLAAPRDPREVFGRR